MGVESRGPGNAGNTAPGGTVTESHLAPRVEREAATAAALGHGVGLFLLAWGLFTTYMFVASLRTTVAIAAVFAALAITFVLLGIGEAGQHTNIIKAGGYVGIVTAALAWYASFAAVTN